MTSAHAHPNPSAPSAARESTWERAAGAIGLLLTTAATGAILRAIGVRLGGDGAPIWLLALTFLVVAPPLFLLLRPIITGFAARPLLLARNLATFLFVVWIIATATFFLAQRIPGGPFTAERQVPAAIMQRIAAQYRLDQPTYVQYLHFLGGLVRLDLGPSYYETGRTVTEIIGYSFPNSLRLGLIAILIAIGVGVPLGVLAAIRQNRWQDYTALGVVVLGVSVPSFIFATLAQYLFAYRMKMLPVSQLAEWRAYVLPSVSMATLAGAFIIRLVRSEMIDVLSSQYITAARARGLARFSIVWKHALRNALLPVVTYLGPVMAGLFTGSFVIETIFDVPGLGRQFVRAIGNRDYNLILGTTIFYSALLVGLNMLIDSVYRVIDPRVRDGAA